jgi:hypothetical protein
MALLPDLDLWHNRTLPWHRKHSFRPTTTSFICTNPTNTNNHPDRHHHPSHQAPHLPLLPQDARNPHSPHERPPLHNPPHPKPQTPPPKPQHPLPTPLLNRPRLRQAPRHHPFRDVLDLALVAPTPLRARKGPAHHPRDGSHGRKRPPLHPPACHLGFLHLSAAGRPREREGWCSVGYTCDCVR